MSRRIFFIFYFYREDAGVEQFKSEGDVVEDEGSAPPRELNWVGD